MKAKDKSNSFSELELYNFSKNLSSKEEIAEIYEAESEIHGYTNFVQNIDSSLITVLAW